jgi:PadR family transcriptional regulator PadR
MAIGEGMARTLQRGDVATLVLAALRDEPGHGYGIARRIEARSGAVLALREGSLYPVLKDLEQHGWVTSSWEQPESGPGRKVYELTEAGSAQLATRAEDWRAYAKAFLSLLGEGRAASA